MTNSNNIVLIGMPGVGKSSVGVVLAKILAMQFVDVDLLIQGRCGKTLQRIIDEDGAEEFIAIEGEVLCGLAGSCGSGLAGDDGHAQAGINCANTVISTGGSACYSPAAIEELRKSGATIVYMQASIDELRRRLGDFSERGIVTPNPDTCTLDALLAERTPLYEALADFTVKVDGMDISEAARSISNNLKS